MKTEQFREETQEIVTTQHAKRGAEKTWHSKPHEYKILDDWRLIFVGKYVQGRACPFSIFIHPKNNNKF
jgi:hypothetical protein